MGRGAKGGGGRGGHETLCPDGRCLCLASGRLSPQTKELVWPLMNSCFSTASVYALADA